MHPRALPASPNRRTTGMGALAAGMMAAAVLVGSTVAHAAAAACPEPTRPSADAAAERVMCLIDSDHMLDAVVYGETAVDEWPRNARLLSALGRAYEETGNRDKALARQEEAFRRAPDDPLIAHRLASLLADEVDRLAPAAEGMRPPPGLAHCFADVGNRRIARERMRKLAERADRLYARAIAGFARRNGEDDIMTLNARMERALLHVTLDERRGLPELEAVAADFRRLAETRDDPAMGDMASGVHLDLAQAYALADDIRMARRVAEEAMALARSADQKRLVAASMQAVDGNDGDGATGLIAAMAGAADCALTTDRDMPRSGGGTDR